MSFRRKAIEPVSLDFDAAALDWTTPTQRAEIVTFRLNYVIGAGLTSEQVKVDELTNVDAPRLKAAGVVIATLRADLVSEAITGERARKRALATARAQATAQVEQWAANLRRALTIPGLAIVGEAGRLVPLGKTQNILITGAAQGALTVTAQGNAVVARADSENKSIVVTGMRPGRDVITVERDGATVRIFPVVKAYAAELATPRTVEVTGRIVPASSIALLARAAAIDSVTLTPGARLLIPEDGFPVAALASGRGQTIAIPVQAIGPDMLPVERKVFVSIVNRPTPPVRAATLFYSNNPERLRGASRLFLGRLPQSAEGGARLLYHHQNDSGRALRFTVEAQNESDAPSRILLTGGDAGPARDTVWVGYRAAADFVQAQENQIGVTLELPPHSRMPLSSLRLPDRLTISGLMQLRVLSGPAPLIKLSAEAAETEALEIVFLSHPLNAERIAASPTPPASLSVHVYANPLEQLKADYQVGGRWTFVPFGKIPRRSVSTDKTLLYGNYGVTYDIALRLSNPTAQTATARVVFEPSAGLAGGVFLVGDRRIEIPRSDMPDETTLASCRLAPGEVRNVRIRTLPVSGSNYPATLIIRP